MTIFKVDLIKTEGIDISTNIGTVQCAHSTAHQLSINLPFTLSVCTRFQCAGQHIFGDVDQSTCYDSTSPN